MNESINYKRINIINSDYSSDQLCKTYIFGFKIHNFAVTFHPIAWIWALISNRKHSVDKIMFSKLSCKF